MDKPSRFEIVEIFMAKCGQKGWDRCFYGTIKRGFDSDGSPVVRGKIKVLDGFICTQAASQDVLGERLDELVKLVLDMGLHDNAGVTSIIACTNFYLN